MNGPRDFGHLKCAQSTKKRIALSLSIWNSADEKGNVRLEAPLCYVEPARSRAKRVGRQLGLKVN